MIKVTPPKMAFLKEKSPKWGFWVSKQRRKKSPKGGFSPDQGSKNKNSPIGGFWVSKNGIFEEKTQSRDFERPNRAKNPSKWDFRPIREPKSKNAPLKVLSRRLNFHSLNGILKKKSQQLRFWMSK